MEKSVLTCGATGSERGGREEEEAAARGGEATEIGGALCSKVRIVDTFAHGECDGECGGIAAELLGLRCPCPCVLVLVLVLYAAVCGRGGRSEDQLRRCRRFEWEAID